MKVHYNPKLKEIARKLRKSSTLSEVLIWQYLKRKQMMGYDFHRQKPIDEYIVDFFCPELGLIIEIDGESHTDRIKDQRRQEKLESLGFHFLRFWDFDAKKNMEGVLSTIRIWIERYEQHTPTSPLNRGDSQ